MTMCRLNLKFKILVKILVLHTLGLIIFDHVRLNLKFHILNEILVGHMWGSQLFLTMYRLNLNFKLLNLNIFKILVEILVGHTWGSIIFDHVQA